MARPAQFDREAALTNAMQLFWNCGYGASSMSDLVTAMDMRPGSIYATFGSKRKLLFEAMEYYARSGQEKIERLVMTSPTVRKGFERVFSQIIKEMADEDVPRGCLLVNLLLELGTVDEQAGKAVQEHLQHLQNIFSAALEKARTAGEIPQGKKLHALGGFLMGSLYSLRVMGRAGASRAELKTYVAEVLSHAFGPR